MLPPPFCPNSKLYKSPCFTLNGSLKSHVFLAWVSLTEGDKFSLLEGLNISIEIIPKYIRANVKIASGTNWNHAQGIDLVASRAGYR